MRWSMDTHKFIGEIPRTALQVITQHGITSNSSDDEIRRTEEDLVRARVYKDFSSASGRIRRALFTYFKAYHCMNDQEQLTQIGRAFVEEKLSIKEFSFYYVVNYFFSGCLEPYYPLQLLLTFLKKIAQRNDNFEYITPYDFSLLVECNSIDDISDEFISNAIDARMTTHDDINERSIGFDVWSKMLILAGIFKKNDHNLYVQNHALCDWILSAFSQTFQRVPGQINSGILQTIPGINANIWGDITPLKEEGNALQAFLFDAVHEDVINKYIIKDHTETLASLLARLGLSTSLLGYYSLFSGLERLVGHKLALSANHAESIIGKILLSVDFSENEEVFEEDSPSGENILLYGVPGAGKSWTVEHEYCSNEQVMERVVFHPDYTYSDFIGQILPQTKNDKVVYQFIPGPFTRILRKAIADSNTHYYLVIEEINRGNAPAIFGDIFQLLDRTKNDTNTCKKGTSVYGITNPEIAKCIYLSNVPDSTEEIESEAVNRLVKIPFNLSIVATMNTADQNVFTLDTAFQRRWKMRMIENDLNAICHADILNTPIVDTNVSWKKFLKIINESIINVNSELNSYEDKRLGIYFVAREDLSSAASWAEKVLKYLWDDAFKFNRDALFDIERFQTLESVTEAFECQESADRFSIFQTKISGLLCGDSPD